MFDIIVIGGGRAGLSAALMLGRCRRSVLLCDRGQPGNQRSRALHGYLTRNGVAASASFSELGQAELVKYGIEFRAIAVTGVQRARNQIAVRTERIVALDHQDGDLSAIRFVKGDAVSRDALFFTTGQHPQSDLAIRLGCSLTRRGTVETGTLCSTNVPGVFVAGDASHDAQFVVAAAEGVKAAVAINKVLQHRELVA